ncbi:MAG TPA: hypothetical protein VF668_11230 [Pyrinomonadaceae bacterium]|jgi:hypothetical protein
MNIRRITLLWLLAVMPPPCATRAQTARAALVAAAASQDAPAVERDEQRRVRVRLAPGGRVALDNRTTGRIVVKGWDRDYVEAVATSTRGAEHVRASSESSDGGHRVSLTADYLSQPWPSSPPPPSPPASAPTHAPTRAPTHAPSPANTRERDEARSSDLWDGLTRLLRSDDVPDEVHLEVMLPRYAEIEVITVNRSEVEVTGVSTAVAVNGRRSAVRLRDVGAAEVRTERGAVEVDGAAGLVDVVTTAGAVSVRNVRGDVRALSLSGRIEVRCVRGRVNAANTEGPVVLADVDGDVDATTVNSDVRFDGLIREEGRYHLKSMSGAVEMGVRRNPPGFTALLSSYRGAVESDFKLSSKQQPKAAPAGARVLGRYGDGRAQVTLDSFDGRVRLGRLQPSQQDGCGAPPRR